MHIYVFGNLNVGKTTFCQHLVKKIDSYRHLCLDSYREKFGDGAIEGEKIAQKHFIEDVANTENAVVDFTGCGEVADELRKKIRVKKGILIVIDCPISIAKANITSEKYQNIPYPKEYKDTFSVAQTMEWLVDKTSLLSLENMWEKQIWQSYSFSTQQSFETFWKAFPFFHHVWIERLTNLVHQQPSISEAVLYGSTGANKLNKESDLDLFISSSFCTDYWHNLLNQAFFKDLIHTNVLDNKIILFTDSSLFIEITVGNNFDDIAYYYHESVIYKESFTLLKEKAGTLDKAIKIDKQSVSLSLIAQKEAAKCHTLFCSLPKLIRNQDTYKYSFYCMIIRHNAIRLEHLLLNIPAHNYLPKHAAKKLMHFPWEAFNSDGETINIEQYHQIFSYLKKLFKQLEQSSLIEREKYFTKQSLLLHTIY